MTRTAPLNVIYIMGSGRSGSTLLSSMLGAQPGILSVGEVYNFKNFFESSESANRFCSCGAELMTCELWSEVRSMLKRQTGNELLDLKNTDPSIFNRNNGILFEALRRASGADLIVDSSKRHYRLDLLLKMPQLNVTIIHLVRDARAYAYSSLLTARQRGQPDTEYYRKLIAWQKKNLGINLIYGRRPGYARLRYEDLVADPVAQLRRVLSGCAHELDAAQLDKPVTNNSHEFSGNKRSIRRGLKGIRLDTRYLENLSASQWSFGSMLTLPALKVFGYPAFSRTPPAPV